MIKGIKKYNKEEKLQILKEAGFKGVRKTLKKYGFYLHPIIIGVVYVSDRGENPRLVLMKIGTNEDL